jgi:hypothetical protein
MKLKSYRFPKDIILQSVRWYLSANEPQGSCPDGFRCTPVPVGDIAGLTFREVLLSPVTSLQLPCSQRWFCGHGLLLLHPTAGGSSRVGTSRRVRVAAARVQLTATGIDAGRHAAVALGRIGDEARGTLAVVRGCGRRADLVLVALLTRPSRCSLSSAAGPRPVFLVRSL